jgi:polysaccharide biosynthesis/export protein
VRCSLTLAAGALCFLGSLISQAGQGTQHRGDAYLLGPDDEVSVRVIDVDEFRDEPLRVEMTGYLNLPLIGRVKAAGLTVQQLEQSVSALLIPYVRSASVIVSVRAFRSQPVSVIGAVNKPGVYQLQGRKTLVEVLSLAEGLRQDAGNTVRVLRSGAVEDGGKAGESQASGVISVAIKALLDGSAPESKLPILPHDVISVPRAEMVYVMGAVRRAGGFVIPERDQISALQALALAEGFDSWAAPHRARVVRGHDGARTEIPLDIRRILEGNSADLRLEAGDILFIPSNGAKKATLRAVEAVIQVGTGVAIYRR